MTEDASRPEAPADQDRIASAGVPESVTRTHAAEGLYSVEDELRSGGSGGGRYEELLEKRRSSGLSDEEANELGRLMAEREGREWSTNSRLARGGADPAS